MGAGTAALLLNVMTLVQAGMEFESIVKQVQSLEAQGATPEKVSDYIKGLRDNYLAALAKDVNG